MEKESDMPHVWKEGSQGNGGSITTNTKALNEQAQEMYLACAFISQADPKRYGRLKEELENDYTKGTDSYQALTNIAQGMWPATKDCTLGRRS